MCRLAGFVGAERPLSSVLFDPPHSLEHQAHSPTEMVSGQVNVDGTGVAWWPPAETEPLRYVTESPPWSDPNLESLSRRLIATTALAAVRSATPGMGFGPGAVQPFVSGGLAGVHNGWIGGFGDGVGRHLATRLPADLFAEIDTVVDSKLAFLVMVDQHRCHRDLAAAVADTACEVAEAVTRRGEAASINLAAATPGRLAAIRLAVGAVANSLFTALRSDGALLASEPLDAADDWEEVPAGTLVDLTPDRVEQIKVAP